MRIEQADKPFKTLHLEGFKYMYIKFVVVHHHNRQHYMKEQDNAHE